MGVRLTPKCASSSFVEEVRPSACAKWDVIAQCVVDERVGRARAASFLMREVGDTPASERLLRFAHCAAHNMSATYLPEGFLHLTLNSPNGLKEVVY